MESNKEKRGEYLDKIQDISPEKLVYIDESGIELTAVKERGWGKKGELLIGKKSGKYYQRSNILAGYVNRRVLSHINKSLSEKT